MRRTPDGPARTGLVDVHCHLDAPAFDADRAEVLHRARAAGVEPVLAASDPARWDALEAMARQHGLVHTLGIHPWWALSADEATVRAWRDDLEARDHPHGLGETGLDRARARHTAARDRLADLTRWHLALARERQVPVVLHCVRAYGTLDRILAEEPLGPAGGVVHGWSGAPEMVRPLLRHGLHLSFGWAAVRHDKVARALEAVPDDRLLVESDSPDQAPRPSTRGEPAHVVALVRALASRRGVSPEHLAAVTRANAERLFPALVTDDGQSGPRRDAVEPAPGHAPEGARG